MVDIMVVLTQENIGSYAQGNGTTPTIHVNSAVFNIDPDHNYTLADIVKKTDLSVDTLLSAVGNGDLKITPIYEEGLPPQARVTGSSFISYLEAETQGNVEFIPPGLQFSESDEIFVKETTREFGDYAMKIPLLTAEGEVGLSRIIRARGDYWEQALHKGIEANYRLVLKLAIKYHKKREKYFSCEVMDFVQESIFALRKAWLKKDPDYRKKGDEAKGPYRFYPYATKIIERSNSKVVRDQLEIIRLPKIVYIQANKIGKYRKKHKNMFVQEPTLEEISSATGIPESQIQLIDNAQGIDSLQMKIGDEDSETTLEDILPDIHTPSPEDSTISKITRENAVSPLEILDNRKADIVMKKFGIGHQRPYTFVEIAKEYDITEGWVSSLFHDAIKELRKYYERNTTADEDAEEEIEERFLEFSEKKSKQLSSPPKPPPKNQYVYEEFVSIGQVVHSFSNPSQPRIQYVDEFSSKD